MSDCNNCQGKGTVIRKAFKLDGIKYPQSKVTCFECNGTGEMCDVSINICEGIHDDEGHSAVTHMVRP